MTSHDLSLFHGYRNFAREGELMALKRFENILFEIEEDKAFLTINRPPLNILNIAAMEDMNKALRTLEDARNVKVLIISGSGDNAFSAGVDIADHTEEKAGHMLHVFHEIFRTLARLDQVTVAALKGLTLGGGCELALFCDLAVAADNVKIGQPEIKLSVFPPVALWILPRLVGMKKAAELLLTGKIIQASEAAQLGLVNTVIPLNYFEEELEKFIQPIRELSLVGIKYTKKGLAIGLKTAFIEGLENIERLYLDELMATEDAREGLKAFLEKRKPLWKNK